jgi:hypothetical protein
MDKPANRCRFCGGAGSSKEHSFAAWIGRAMTPPLDPDMTVTFHHRSENPEAGVAPTEKQAKGAAFITRAFCVPCNTGWMSQLEDAAQQILEPMIRGQARDLSSDDQRVLAMWAIKTVLAFQTMEHPITTFATPEDFREIYEPQAPIGRAQVWIAADPRGESCWYRAHNTRLHGSVEPDVDGFGATLLIGRVVFYILIGRERSFDLRLRGDAARAMRNIWPGRGHGTRWPSPIVRKVREPEGLAPYVIAHGVIAAA